MRVASTPKAFRLVKQVAGNAQWCLNVRGPLSRRRLLRQDQHFCAHTDYAPTASAGYNCASTTAGHQRPREEWIQIPVPALVTEESFARARAALPEQRYDRGVPSPVSSAGAGQLCEVWLRPVANINANQRRGYCYKCIGSDSWRKLGGPVCDNGYFIRQELLDQIVWTGVIRLLEEPALIHQELDPSAMTRTSIQRKT